MLVVAAACGNDPPNKEIQQAQSAIQVARTAGADEYAREELVAADEALKRAHDAVGQRDYRLALDNAIESREQAQNAAKEATERLVAARTEAEQALRDVTSALSQAQGRLKAAEVAHVSSRLLSEAHDAVDDGEMAVQKARAAVARGQYRQVAPELKGATARLSSTIKELDAARAAAGRRHR